MIIDGTPTTIGITTPATAMAAAAAVDITDNSQQRDRYNACAPLVGVCLRLAAARGAAAPSRAGTTSSGGPYATIALIGANTGYMDTQVTGGITYYYAVTSLRGPDESTLSTQVSAKPK